VDKPLATIGIPVYQGGNYLDETLASARLQDYENLEIIVTDNASTDDTPEIVERHASEDARIRYVRHERNQGAAENYNSAFHASSGEYFCWNAHDDLTTPDFISSGVEALERHPEASVALAHVDRINARGDTLDSMEISGGVFSSSPAARFRAAARSHPVTIVFGLYRSRFVAESRLHGKYTGSDRNFIAEMMLRGPAVMAGNSRFLLREHESRSVRVADKSESRFSHAREGWFATDREGRIVFPSWRRFGGYVTAVTRARLSARERMECYIATLQLLFDDRMKLLKYMVNDLVTAAVMAWRGIRQR
jgi:glycosyltransferase involved in cell wall biosynthesis